MLPRGWGWRVHGTEAFFTPLTPRQAVTVQGKRLTVRQTCGYPLCNLMWIQYTIPSIRLARVCSAQQSPYFSQNGRKNVKPYVIFKNWQALRMRLHHFSAPLLLSIFLRHCISIGYMAQKLSKSCMTIWSCTVCIDLFSVLVLECRYMYSSSNSLQSLI